MNALIALWNPFSGQMRAKYPTVGGRPGSWGAGEYLLALMPG